MRKRRIVPVLLLLPFGILMAIFAVGLASGVVQSFGIVPSLGLTEPTLRYYREILSSETFRESVRYSLYLSVVSSVLAVLGGILLCLAIETGRKRHPRMQWILELPILVPHVVVALFVMNLFSQSGLLARVLFTLGMIRDQSEFPGILYGPGGAGIILAYLWKEIPYVAFCTVTLMASVSQNLGETARNLGATPGQAFFRVILPPCAPAIQNAFLIILAFSFGAYELPFLLGPTAPKALPVAAYLEYLSPELRNRPKAMAMNTVMLLISLAMVWAYYLVFVRQVRLLRKKVEK